MSNVIKMPERRIKTEKEKTKPVNIKKRLPFLYIEGSSVSIKNGEILVEMGEEKEKIPLKTYALIIFSERCKITTAAIQIMTDKGCAVSIESKNKLPSVSFTRKYRGCAKKYKQYQKHIDLKERTKIAKKLLEARNKTFEDMNLPIRIKTGSGMNVPTLMANEGNAMKQFYSITNKIYKTQYSIRDDKPMFLSLAYYLFYSVCSAVLYSVNLDQNLGFLHGKSKGGGFIFDLTDVFKPLIYQECVRLEKDPNFKPYMIYKEMESFFEKQRFNKKLILLLKDLDLL